MRRCALLLIGVAACGLDLTAVQDEIPILISARLQPAVRGYVLALVSGDGDAPCHMSTMTPIDDDAVMDDALLDDADGAGFDVRRAHHRYAINSPTHSSDIGTSPLPNVDCDAPANDQWRHEGPDLPRCARSRD